MNYIITSTLVLIGGALLLTLITIGPALKRRFKAPNKVGSHEQD